MHATMSKADYHKLMREEAVRKLRNYLKSGIAGFRQQGLDRLRECGIVVDAFREAGPRDIAYLVAMIEAGDVR